MRIAIGADHAGFPLNVRVMDELRAGALTLDLMGLREKLRTEGG